MTTPDPAMLERMVKAEAELSRAITLLKQACGIIVEFGDLNGFRNLSNQELGKAVRETAIAIGEFLNEVAPVTDEQKASVEANRRAAAAVRE